ncbi:MAG: two-component system, cell cycle response regulator [Acidobacteriota bacterium]|jgi:diguanylate cyclase (GGDEF)-like protein|nr:two-component system, cell cycle response regulator [Acidobacteriota bacterium]
MKRSRSPRDLWASLLPIVGGAVALAAAFEIPRLAPGPPIPAWLLVTLILAGAILACHRPATGVTTLGLGVMILPLAFRLGGAARSALLAASALVISDLALRLIRGLAVLQPPERRALFPRLLEDAGRAALSTLAAGTVWAWLDGRWSPVAVLTAAAGAYFLVEIGLDAADPKIRRPEAPLRWRLVLTPLSLDLGGWIAGAGLLLVGLAAGWTLAAFLTGCFVALVIETLRHGLLREKAQFRARDLERLRRAAQRISTPAGEMASIAERIRAECEKVVHSFWFQFETLAPGSEFKSWWWGPESEILEDGVPEPDLYPPKMPGFHKRTSWQILERQLRSRPDGTILGRIRLWCDPRRIDERQIELLDRLLPQMTLSVQRCLLDREAREDPLTGVALRRVLEKRLHEIHARACETGESMAVILCDLDHFKRINDTWGHPAGDAALVAVAGVLKQLRREEDLCCRYGGEEFVLLMEGTNGEDALSIAERLRHSIEALDFQVEEQRVPLTLSAGVASFPDLYIKTGAELILFADEALYEAKRRGRNRCLLDIGQGRYLDVEGTVLTTEEAHQAAEAPRIFA